jgi:hypothetical protein
MVRVLASGAVDHGFSGVMVRVLDDSGDVDPGFQWCYSTIDESSNHYTTETQDLQHQRRAL